MLFFLVSKKKGSRDRWLRYYSIKKIKKKEGECGIKSQNRKGSVLLFCHN